MGKGLKVYIHFDMEGVAGNNFATDPISQSPLNTWHTLWQRKLSTGEVQAAVKGALEAGADTIWINDKHFTGFNLNYEEFEPPVELIQGRGARQPTFMPGLNETWDAVVFVGAFAKGGTWGAVGSHQLWFIESINDKGEATERLEVGIFGVVATGAGYYDVPVVFVSGDDFVCREAEELIPGIETGVVKVALGRWAARSLSHPAACDLIRLGVAEGIKRRKEIKSVKLHGPRYRIVVGPDPEDMWHDKAVEGDDLLKVWESAQNVLWSDFGNYVDDGYAWPDRIQVGADGKHTTAKRAEYDAEVE
jgi:D-amino peptidase